MLQQLLLQLLSRRMGTFRRQMMPWEDDTKVWGKMTLTLERRSGEAMCRRWSSDIECDRWTVNAYNMQLRYIHLCINIHTLTYLTYINIHDIHIIHDIHVTIVWLCVKSQTTYSDASYHVSVWHFWIPTMAIPPFRWPDMTWPYVTQVPPPKQRSQAPRLYPDAPTSAVSWRSPAHFVEDWVHHGASIAPKTVVHGGQSAFRCRILLGFCCLLRFIHALLRIQCAKSEANDKPWSWQDDLAEVDLGFHNNMFLVFFSEAS